MKPEIAEAIKNVNIYEMAQKTEFNPSALTEDEKTVISQLDKHFKEIGKTGCDKNREIATFVQKVITDEYVNAPDELLDEVFDRGSIGEFDDFEGYTTPKNTLVAYECAKGGNVPRSFLDITALTPTTKHLQVETDISYADIRKNGWKTIAMLTNYAMESLQNKRYAILFKAIDDAIHEGSTNYLLETGTTVSQSTMDAGALYTNDRTANGICIALSKYIQQASKLTGFTSQAMMDEIHRNGSLGDYDGVKLRGISSANKLGDGSTQFPDKLMLFIAGKIGELDEKGEVRVYETMDNDDEKTHIKVTGYEFTYAFNKDTLDKIFKVVMTK